MQSLTSVQALANLDQAYHSQFEEIHRTFLARDEQLVAAANCTMELYLGFFLVTEFRVISVVYTHEGKWSERRKHIRYYKKGVIEVHERFWFLLPLKPLSAQDLKGRKVLDVPFTSIQSVVRKEYRPNAPGGVILHLIELEFVQAGAYGGNICPIEPTAFDYEDGQTIYDVTLNAIQSRGMAADDDAKGVVSELERLAALRTAGLLSEEEFLAAKRKLLGLS